MISPVPRSFPNYLRIFLLLWLSWLAITKTVSVAQAEQFLARGPAFEQVFSEAALPMLLIDPVSGQIRMANAAAARFYGYDRQRLSDMHIQQINTFTSEQIASERALARSEGRNYFIFRHRLANGETRLVAVHSRPYLFDGQTLLYSVISDVTPERHPQDELWRYQQALESMVDAQLDEIERGQRWLQWTLAGALLAQALVIVLLVRNIGRRRELEKRTRATNKALSDSRHQLESAQRIARVGSWRLDQQARQIHCSREMKNILELESETFEQPLRQAMERIHPDDMERVKRRYADAIDQGMPYDLEHRLLMPDGRVKHVHVRSESHCLDDGCERVTVGTVQDVTRQHVVQAALGALAGEFAPLTGDAFYLAVCCHLRQALGLDYVFVGQLSSHHDRVEVCVGCTSDGEMQPFDYSLQGTPCSNVMKTAHAVYPDKVAEMYPADPLLGEMGVRSYIGSSLLDKRQQPMGILVGLGRKPLLQAELARELMGVFVERVDAEMQRSAVERRLEKTDAYRQIVLRFSSRFINLSLSEVDKAIQDALHEIGEFIGADSCYLFAYDHAAGVVSMTHEWCTEDMPTEKELLQRLPVARLPVWLDHHQRGEAVVVEDTSRLNEPLVAEVLKRKSVKCLVDQPLMNNGICTGFVGVVSRQRVNLFSSHTGGLLRLFADLLVNVRQRQQVEGELRLSASVFDNADESIMIADVAGQILSVNGAFTRTTGYAAEQAVGRSLSFMNTLHGTPGSLDTLWQQLRNFGSWKGEAWNVRPTGERYAVLQKINAFHDEQGVLQGYVSLMSDITPFKQHQRELERIAHFDALTGLPNRTLLADRLQQAMALAQRRQRNIATLFIDLDGFKSVNDNYSHAVGDRLLVRLAGRMQQEIRQEDTLGRLGGDEFVAVLVDLDNTEASLPVIRRLLDVVSEPVRFDGLELKVSASIGVAFYPQQDSLDADQLLRQADQAMYQAKQAGKNRYQLFDVERDRALRSQHDSLTRIAMALEREELVLYYQPKVNMRTGALVGCEALIRWQHPERGLLMPADFLPVIENQYLAVDIGNWVLETVLDQILAWRGQGLEIPISANIDAIHLQQPDFVEHLGVLLERRPDIRSGDLELEILETTALDDVDYVSTVIHACKALGIRFALDDFGTGYSSLTYLKRLPAEVLKIDRSFVHDMLADQDDLAILTGVIQLADAFKREVIAEGVETEQHCRELLALGCELGQGYAIARPMPAEALPAWLSRRSCPAED
ncbi:sensor domain-containing protein [Marinobacterium marinum]|uniref:EAL domain-containing protein n=1 Tax=Marinobacterium marinum TaxID=2756129 RepID=A0A7W2ACH6_9GAMM|nr:EAL domain-containing protein [Marinobacterium marinum]MBA4502557.1 EAL domain-containing protein [Marinobacterium marinum]